MINKAIVCILSSDSACVVWNEMRDVQCELVIRD